MQRRCFFLSWVRWCGTNRGQSFLLPRSSFMMVKIVPTLKCNDSTIFVLSFCDLTSTTPSPTKNSLHFNSNSDNPISHHLLTIIFRLWILKTSQTLRERFLASSPYAHLIISQVSVADFSNLKQNLIYSVFVCCFIFTMTQTQKTVSRNWRWQVRTS